MADKTLEDSGPLPTKAAEHHHRNGDRTPVKYNMGLGVFTPIANLTAVFAGIVFFWFQFRDLSKGASDDRAFAREVTTKMVDKIADGQHLVLMELRKMGSEVRRLREEDKKKDKGVLQPEDREKESH